MRAVTSFLTTVVVVFSSCTTEPIEVASATVEELGFEWRVPYAMTLNSNDHPEAWTGSAVWIDRGTLMLTFNDANAMEPSEVSLVATEMLSYNYNEVDRTVRLFLEQGNVTLLWNAMDQRFEGDVFHQDLLRISRTEEVQQN